MLKLAHFAKEAVRDAARRISNLIQSTKSELERTAELYNSLCDVNQNAKRTLLQRVNDSIQIIAKFRDKKYTTNVTWHEGFIFRVAYLYFFNYKYKPLKKEIKVLNQTGASQSPAGQQLTTILNKLYAFLKAIQPGEFNCPTLSQYCERAQFSKNDPLQAPSINIENLDVLEDLDPREHIDIENLIDILLDADFYQVALHKDPLALVLWSYIMGVITALRKMNSLALPKYAAMTFNPTGFLNKINDNLRIKGITVETEARTDVVVVNHLDDFFAHNMVLITTALDSIATKKLYQTRLDELDLNPGIRRTDWLKGIVEEISGSGKPENFLLFAEAFDEKAQQFFTAFLPKEEIYEPLVAKISAPVAPAAAAKQRMSFFLTGRQDLHSKITNIDSERPMLLMGLVMTNFKQLSFAKADMKTPWEFYFAWNLAIIQFVTLKDRPDLIPKLPEAITNLIKAYDAYAMQFSMIIKEILPLLQNEKIYESTEDSSSLPGSRPAAAAAASSTPSKEALYTALDSDEGEESNPAPRRPSLPQTGAAAAAHSSSAPHVSPRHSAQGIPTVHTIQDLLYERAHVNTYYTSFDRMPPINRHLWLAVQIDPIKHNQDELYSFAQALDERSQEFFAKFYEQIGLGLTLDPEKAAFRRLQIEHDLATKMASLEKNREVLLTYLARQIKFIDLDLVDLANSVDWEFYFGWIATLVLHNSSRLQHGLADTLRSNLISRMPSHEHYEKQFEFIISQIEGLIPGAELYGQATMLSPRAPTPPPRHVRTPPRPGEALYEPLDPGPTVANPSGSSPTLAFGAQPYSVPVRPAPRSGTPPLLPPRASGSVPPPPLPPRFVAPPPPPLPAAAPHVPTPPPGSAPGSPPRSPSPPRPPRWDGKSFKNVNLDEKPKSTSFQERP
jgi:hypothetical protein